MAALRAHHLEEDRREDRQEEEEGTLRGIELESSRVESAAGSWRRPSSSQPGALNSAFARRQHRFIPHTLAQSNTPLHPLQIPQKRICISFLRISPRRRDETERRRRERGSVS